MQETIFKKEDFKNGFDLLFLNLEKSEFSKQEKEELRQYMISQLNPEQDLNVMLETKERIRVGLL